MILPLITTLIALIFGIAAVILSIREDRMKKELLDRDRKQKQRIYEISILKEVQDRIGYELDLEKIIDVIIGSLRDLFPYSSASCLFIENGTLIFKSFLEEEVSKNFVTQVKKAMQASLLELLEKPLPEKIDENIYGLVLNDSNQKPMASFFHIPLTINNKVVGLISVASTTAGLYKEDEMTILYQITNQASNALSRLQNVLTTEKGKLMAMIGSLADGVFMVDTNNKLLVINDSAKKLLGIHKDNPTILDLMSSSSSPYNFAEKIKQSISQNIKIVEKEVCLGEKTVQIFITPVCGENAVFGASILLQDITLEKNLTKMKEDFTNIIIHELRAPLTAVKGASEVMVESFEKLDQAEAKKLLKIIGEQTKKLLDEVSLLLDAGRLEAGQFTLNKEVTDLKKLILERVQIFIPMAETKKIMLTANIEDGLPFVNIDPVRIEQVVNNLISNSLKFTHEGGKITMSAKNGQKGYIAISVSDTGIGIPKERQNEVFSKFSQIAYPTEVYTKEYPILGGPVQKGYNLQHLTSGTGLGLFIVKAIVEAHHGTVTLDSEEGKGTTITLTLPVS